MSDYFGPNQTRVLDPTNRSFEEVICQRNKPYLSSEANLSGQILANRDQDPAMRPSGWATVGQIRQDTADSSCMAGDLIASDAFPANTVKLIALDKGVETGKSVAWVNGWKLQVQGSDSTTENNIITLDTPPSSGTRVDFVFLEAWRKLVYPTDTVYEYGNLLYGGINPSNDLIDPAINIETTLRVQVQYRIRVVKGIDIESFPDGFDSSAVFVQGPLSAPIDNCNHAYFSPVPEDIGLWRAGAGDSVAQETLQTVDGYTYAVPMFAIARRNTSAYDLNGNSNGSADSKTDHDASEASDRPDDKFNNIIHSTDIMDLRHRISGQDNYSELCRESFEMLMKGTLHTKMGKNTLGGVSYGATLLQADAVSISDEAGSKKINDDPPDGYRRIFSNASMTQVETFARKTSLVVWGSGDTVTINLAAYPSGYSVSEVLRLYYLNTSLNPYVSTSISSGFTVSSLPSSLVTITLGPSFPLLGTTISFNVEYSISMPAGPNGLSLVPDKILEFRKEGTSLSIASQDQDIMVRTAPPVINADGTHINMLSNRGGSWADYYDFGHQMIYHVTGNGTDTFSISRTISSYPILGVASITAEGRYPTISVTRSGSAYTINMDQTVTSNRDIELSLYVGTKFFETNKQGRAITDTFEMKEFTAMEPANGSRTIFTLDGGENRFLALCSYNKLSGSGYAYVNGVQTTITSPTNKVLPGIGENKTYLQVTLSSIPSALATIEVPVMVRSAISGSEGYTCFYQTTPYQGLLDSTTTGHIEALGPAIITSAGSGAITDATYSVGTISASGDATVVGGTSTEWLSYVSAGDVLTTDGTHEYEISQVLSDIGLWLTSPTKAALSGTYTIKKKDQPFYTQRNVIDRMPAYDTDSDASGNSAMISTAATQADPVLETRVISRTQDVMDYGPNEAVIGANTAERGRSTISLNGPLGKGNLGLVFEKLSGTDYHKAYQSYVLNKDNDGHLQLMVVGSETNNTTNKAMMNPASDKDSVDLFNLPGRPLTNRRTA